MTAFPHANPGEMIVGYRFEVESDFSRKIRSGSGATVIVDKVAISGPIYQFMVSVGDDGQPLDQALFFVKCKGCNEQSKYYKIRSIYMTSWAHSHRCQRRNDRPLGPSDGM